jgi:hypothetical protein
MQVKLSSRETRGLYTRTLNYTLPPPGHMHIQLYQSAGHVAQFARGNIQPWRHQIKHTPLQLRCNWIVGAGLLSGCLDRADRWAFRLELSNANESPSRERNEADFQGLSCGFAVVEVGGLGFDEIVSRKAASAERDCCKVSWPDWGVGNVLVVGEGT